eukprot:CAMPEP_0113477646 /NCGR_PEP_ID=MMETSP0014_2-20120614/20315_1 /TAXON_ID=2857 /ORGANISM="Nitzschia sp." /LENGTH=191 /DNA_ID=CAMNT_0000370747 /DNA_START=361 /DNA_END=936 /DNA_ORIENTATION=+ /assembly_acc=CAM_ASM_000159
MVKATTSSSKKAAPVKAKASPKSSQPAREVILAAMAKLWHRGNKTPDKTKVESVSQLNKKTFANTVAKLKQNGLLTATGSTFELTDEGLKKTKDMDLGGTTNAQVHEKIKSQLKGKFIKLFEVLSDGEIHSKDDVARALDFAGGKSQKGFVNMMGVMKNKEELILYPTKDTVQLVKETCFPFEDQDLHADI